jgi:hypothetical protein
MSTFITIDGADYVELNYKGSTYYIGEESVLNSDKTEIGYICARGGQTVIAATVDRNIIADRWFEGDQCAAIETDGDIIDVILSLHEGE